MKHPGLRLVLVLGLGAVAVFPWPASAQNDFSTLGLFLADVGNRPCTIDPPPCDENVQVSGELYLPYYAYVCVFNGDRTLGVSGLQFSIRYDAGANSGVDVWEWHSCATLEFAEPGWPASGTGNVITWDPENACQRRVPSGGEGVTAVAGYFYLTAYSDDLLEVAPHPAIGDVRVADCNAKEYILRPDHYGALGFSDDGNTKGVLPCSSVEVENTTWSGIKRTVGNDGH